MSERPIILGIVGDSAAGKTTLTKGVAQVLGEENVTVICTDDYHRYDRRQRAELGITPLPRLQLHGYHAAAYPYYGQDNRSSNRFTVTKLVL